MFLRPRFVLKLIQIIVPHTLGIWRRPGAPSPCRLAVGYWRPATGRHLQTPPLTPALSLAIVGRRTRPICQSDRAAAQIGANDCAFVMLTDGLSWRPTPTRQRPDAVGCRLLLFPSLALCPSLRLYPSCPLRVPLFALTSRHNRWLSGGLCRAVRTIYRSRVFCSLFDLIVVPARISPLCHTSLLFFSLSLPVLPLIAKSSPSYPISPLVTRGRRLFAASPTFSAPRPFLLSTFPLPLGVRCRSQSAALSPVGSRHTRAAPGWKHRHPQLPAVNVANEWCARRRLQGVAGLEMESLCQCGGTYWCCAFLQVSERRLTGLGKISIPLVGSWHLVTSAGRRELLSCRLTSTMFLRASERSERASSY